MKLKKGSAAAKAFMAKIRAKRKKNTKVSGTKKATIKPFSKKKAVKKAARKKTTSYHKDTASHNVKISVVSGLYKSLGSLFDTSTIKDLDDLKKQYYKLAKQYHPDAGGTKEQFQQLQNEYDSNFNTILKGGTLNKEQQQNEIVIDKAIRDIIDNLINLEGITIEVIGKWLWVGGNTYPVHTILKGAGLQFIKKAGTPYWVYKGIETTSRGKMTLEQIRKAHGSQIVKATPTKKISGVYKKFNKAKVKTAFNKLTKALNKRYK